ncbi:uroporphyrinogen-III synthase [Kaarinaea lacus]
MMSNSLAGITVINTRPAHQAKPLSDLIIAAGGTVVEFPVIDIRPPSDSTSLQSQLADLGNAHFAIFVSANAVDSGINALGGPQNWPNNVAIAAVGRATAAKCSMLGLDASLVAPEPFNSEALLTLPGLQELSGKKVTIFRGEGGREFLADVLRDRGADVEYAECYRRAMPDSVPTDLYQCWDEKRVVLIVVTSNEALHNLFNLVDEKHRPDLLASTLVVISQRAISLASELGFRPVPELTGSASNEAIMETILQWSQNKAGKQA